MNLDGSGRWSVEQLYGTDPYADPLVQPNDPADCPPYDVQRSREIELDRTGQYLFVTSSSALNYHPTASPPFANDWLLIFRTSGNPNETRQSLVQLTLPIRSPTALHASTHDDYLYLTSSINPAGQSAWRGGPEYLLHERGKFDLPPPVPSV